MLELEEVEVSFGKTTVLRKLSMSIDAGQLVSLLGRNGCGKSTTLGVIAGTLRPSHGRVLFRDAEITQASVAERIGLGIVLIPQGRRLFPRLSVEENLRLGGFTIRDKAMVSATLAKWYDTFPQVAAMRRKQAGALSGGQQQLVAIVRAMVAQPSLLLLDEPSLGLDPGMVEELKVALRSVRETDDVTMVLVEQEVPLALELGDRVLGLRGGRVVLDEPPSALHDEEVLADIYFGAADP